MKRQPRILAGTALGLLMASAPLGAFPLVAARHLDFPHCAADPRAGGMREGENCPPKQDSSSKSNRRPRRSRPLPNSRPRSLQPQPEPAAGTAAEPAPNRRQSLKRRPNPKRLHQRLQPSSLRLPNSRRPSPNRLRSLSPNRRLKLPPNKPRLRQLRPSRLPRAGSG